MRHRTWAWALLAVGLSAATAVAQPRGGGPRHHGPPHGRDGAMRAIGALLQADGLSDEQRTQMHAVLEAGRDEVGPLLEQLRSANDALVDQLLGPETPTAEALDAQMQSIAVLQLQLTQHQAQTVLALRQLLSAEQLAAALAESQQRRGERDVIFFRN
ncbi:MAG: Spy/CpxP family protein refolding chaperone [Candidatus Binatia bacterium]